MPAPSLVRQNHCGYVPLVPLRGQQMEVTGRRKRCQRPLWCAKTNGDMCSWCLLRGRQMEVTVRRKRRRRPPWCTKTIGSVCTWCLLEGQQMEVTVRTERCQRLLWCAKTVGGMCIWWPLRGSADGGNRSGDTMPAPSLVGKQSVRHFQIK